MAAHEAQSLVDRYLRAVGRAEGGPYRLGIVELNWLVDHCSQLDGLRLGLLRGLQSALPRSPDSGVATELKEILTNLIIMYTRLAERKERLSELLHPLADGSLLDGVDVDLASLSGAIEAMEAASRHVRAVAVS